jgi:thioredoxin reductase
MKRVYDYIIVGAGPAGCAAATRAGAYGLSVLVIDEQQIPGGQIYRTRGRTDARRMAILGKDYQHGGSLIEAFHRSKADYLPRAMVWQLTPNAEVYYLCDGKAGRISARRILIATGAQERPVPIPGWTLPGVMGAGAMDVLFKSSAMVPEGKVVLAGTGPLLYLVTCHLAECGVDIKAVLDTRTFGDYLKAVPWLPRAMQAPEYLLKGLRMRTQILRRRIPYYHAVRDLRASGSNRVAAVSFEQNGQTHSIETNLLLLHDGVVPNTQMTRQLECDHVWDPVQRYWKPKLDRWGNTSVANISVAGDTSGIYGAKSAHIAGELAAVDTACCLGAISSREKEKTALPLQKQLKRARAIRPFLDSLFQPHPEFYRPVNDDTIVCRCEEITAGQIRETAALGGLGPNQIKAQIRSGMGPCQGRMCGLTVSEIIADVHQLEMPDVGYFHIRPPLKPIHLNALANMEID